MVERITVSMDEELYEQIMEELEYGDSRSEWVREAIEMRFGVEAGEGNLKSKIGATAD